MFSVDKVEVAIKKLTKGTMHGASGITIDLIADPTWRGEMAKHISRVAIDCFQRGELLCSMGEVIISILYKGKGLARDLCASYRPVSLTDMTLRVIDKC